jgi:hypothetical protein
MLKGIIVSLALASLASLTSCTSTSFTKTVVTKLDGQGRVTDTTVTEIVIQPNRSDAALHGEYLKGL